MINILKVSMYVMGILFGSTLLVFILINSFDEKLNPNITALLNRPAMHQIKSENAYYSLLGLYAGNKVTPHKAGIFLEKKHRERPDSTLVESAVELKNYKEPGFTSFIQAKKESCNVSSNNNCLDDYRKSKTEHKKSLSSNKLLLSRYLQLHDYNYFYETQDDRELKWSYGLLRLQRLFHAQTAFTWIYKNKKDALISLNKDVQFWRMVLKSGSSLIGKMIALAMLEKDINLLSQFISECSNCDKNNTIINNLLEKLSENELSLRAALEKEFMHNEQALKDVLVNNKYTPGRIVAYQAFNFIYQVNATRNKLFNHYETILNIASDNRYSVLNRYQKIKTFEQIKENNNLNIINFFYNPIGEMLTTVSIPSSGKYLVAPYRTQALILLVKIKLNIIQNGMTKDEIKLFLEHLPLELISPLSSKPPIYSENENGIYYDFIEDSRIFVKI